LGGFVGRVGQGVIVGTVAAFGAHLLGIEWRYAWSLIAFPVVFALLDIFAGLISNIFLVFGVSALL
jgi:hypothetical protein